MPGKYTAQEIALAQQLLGNGVVKATPQQKKKKNFLIDNISTLGGMAGGALGTIAAPVVGTGIGAAAGAGVGQTLENILTGDKIGKDVAKESVINGVLSAGPIKLAKYGAGFAKGLRAAPGAAVVGEELLQGIGRSALPNVAADTAVSAVPKTLEGAVGSKVGSNFEAAMGSLFKAPENTVTRALSAGDKLAMANNSGLKAVNKSFRQIAGEKLNEASNDLVVKQFRLNRSQLTDFKNKYKEDASQVIKRYSIKSPEDVVTKAIQPISSEYDSMISKIGNVPTATVKANFDTAINKLASKAPSEYKRIAQALKMEADDILGRYGDMIPAEQLNVIKQQFDSLVNYTDKAANPALYRVNKQAADVFRSTLNKAADGLGLATSSGQSLEKAGLELSKLQQLSRNVMKQADLGRGNLPINIGNLPGAIMGSAVNVPTAAAGYIANATINSPTGRSALATGADSLANILLKGAAKNKITTPVGAAIRSGAAGLASSGVNQLSLDMNNSTNTNANNMTNTLPMNSNMVDQSYNNVSDLSSEGVDNSPLSPANINNTIQSILQNGGGLKDVAQLLSMAKDYQALTQTQSKPLSAEQQKLGANVNSALNDIQVIRSELQRDPNIASKASLPGGSLSQRLTGTTNYSTAIANVADVLGRLRSGGAINSDEYNRFIQQLPAAFNSPQDAEQKLSRLEMMLSQFAQ